MALYQKLLSFYEKLKTKAWRYPFFQMQILRILFLTCICPFKSLFLKAEINKKNNLRMSHKYQINIYQEKNPSSRVKTEVANLDASVNAKAKLSLCEFYVYW